MKKVLVVAVLFISSMSFGQISELTENAILLRRNRQKVYNEISGYSTQKHGFDHKGVMNEINTQSDAYMDLTILAMGFGVGSYEQKLLQKIVSEHREEDARTGKIYGCDYINSLIEFKKVLEEENAKEESKPSSTSSYKAPSSKGLNQNAQDLKSFAQKEYGCIKRRAVNKWGNDHSMIVHEINKQADGWLEFNKLNKKFSESSKEKDIVLEAFIKWMDNGDDCSMDWSMAVYEIEKQIEALNAY